MKQLLAVLAVAILAFGAGVAVKQAKYQDSPLYAPNCVHKLTPFGGESLERGGVDQILRDKPGQFTVKGKRIYLAAQHKEAPIPVKPPMTSVMRSLAADFRPGPDHTF